MKQSRDASVASGTQTIDRSLRCSRRNAFLVALALFAASAAALAGDLDKVLFFNIESQTLDKALLQFGAQVHMQLSFAPSSARHALRTRELKGRYAGSKALGELLRGTGLRYIANGQTIEILPEVTSHPSKMAVPAGRRSLQDVSRDQKITNATVVDPPAKHSKAKKTTLREVVVTGSRLPTAEKDGAQEVQVYGRAQIDESGQTSISNFLSTLPSVSTSSNATAMGVGATVQLRGLPVGTTLVLLDGRRIESGGLGYWQNGVPYFDLNNVPLAAVERIEVGENGSSAVYGSDAIAGVVNIILRKDFNGFEMNAKYGWANDFGEAHTNLAWGKQWNHYGFSLIGSYTTNGGLLNTQRLLSASNDYERYGGPDNNYPVCFPGNVFSTDGLPLPGAPVGSGATYAAIAGSATSGKPALSQFAYGTLNTCPLSNGTSLLAPMHRASVLVQGHVDIAPDIQLFTELMFTSLSQVSYEGYDSLFGVQGYQQYTVSATNPYNPFGTTVGIAEALPQFRFPEAFSTEFFRPLIGIKGTLARWQWELSTWQSTDWTQDLLSNALPNGNAIQAALNSSEPNSALNPFVDGPVAPQSLLQSLFLSGNIKWMSRDRFADAFIRGPVVRLPAGDVSAVIGATYVKSAFDENDLRSLSLSEPSNIRLDYGRNYYSVFGETRVPILSRRSSERSSTLLSLDVAGRHDQYSDFGGATTGQFGLVLKPVDGLVVRGEYGDAYIAPSLPDLDTPRTTTPTDVIDPITGATTPALLLLGGNSRLHATTGHSHTVGVVYSSAVLPGFVLSVTQWQVVENNAIQSIGPQVIVNNAQDFPGAVVRNSAGVIQEVDDTYANFGNISAAGLDYEVNYRHAFRASAVSVAVSGTETYRYLEALVPGVQAANGDSVAQDDGDWTPRWKGAIDLDYTRGWMTDHVDGRYTGPYDDYDSTRRIGNFWIIDANVRWDIGQWLWSDSIQFGGAYIEAGATNLFNRAPQFSNFTFDFYGYDSAQMSILGREIYVETGVRW